MFPLSLSRKKFTAVAVAAGLALASLSACSGAGASSSSSGKPTLTIATPSPPQSLDPSLSSGGQMTLFQSAAYQSLFHVSGNSDVAPSLASGFEWVGEGNTTLKVTLRPNIKFSDGEPLNAAAVKKWIEHFKEQRGDHSYVAAPIESVDAPDDLTVIFNLSGPTPQLPLDLTERSGMGAIGSPKALDGSVNMGQATDGAGPFMLSADGTVEGSTYTYVRNPNYFNPDAIDFDKVVVKVIGNSSTAFTALQSGQVDVTYGDAANADAAKAAGLHQAAFPVNVLGLWTSDPNGEVVPALGDIRVRQALQYAVDRNAIANAAAPGSGKGTLQPVTPDSLGYDESLESLYPYDPAKATALLSEAGYADGFAMTVVVAPGNDHRIAAQALADQLAKVGITLTLRTPATFTEWVQDALTGDYAILIGLGLNGMPSTMDNLFDVPGLANFRSAAYPDLLELANKAAQQDGDAASTAWQAVTAKEIEDAYQLPIVNTSSIYYWGDTVSGVEGSSLLNPAYITSTK